VFKNGWIQLDIEKLSPNKSLIDQILEEMFSSIRNKEEFDDKVVSDLTNLAAQGQLTNYEKIIEIIK
jgi:hypothetical protein